MGEQSIELVWLFLAVVCYIGWTIVSIWACRWPMPRTHPRFYAVDGTQSGVEKDLFCQEEQTTCGCQKSTLAKIANKVFVEWPGMWADVFDLCISCPDPSYHIDLFWGKGKYL